jgi:hypothetical protein
MPGRHNALSRVPDVLTEDGIGGIEVPPGKKMLEIFDACGLYLLVERKAKGWRFRWQRDGKERLMSLGPWPKIGLAEARQKGQAARPARQGTAGTLARSTRPATARYPRSQLGKVDQFSRVTNGAARQATKGSTGRAKEYRRSFIGPMWQRSVLTHSFLCGVTIISSNEGISIEAISRLTSKPGKMMC